MTNKATAVSEADAGEDVLHRVGRLVRMLHETMRELGLDAEVHKAAQAIPDARDRLGYIASMTEQAAERALNAVDRAQPIQQALEERAQGLQQRWNDWFDSPVELDDARELVVDTRRYLDDIPAMTQETNRELLDIMMAQDFQDLTGQVIKRMMDVVRDVEFELLGVLLEGVPETAGRDALLRRSKQIKDDDSQRRATLLNGPQINPEASDVISSQDEVDDLLADLGF